MPTDPKVLAVARAYHQANAEALGLPAWSDEPATVTVDKDAGRLAGAAFHALPHDPHHPDVKAAYDALKAETLKQYQHAVAHGVKFEQWRKEGQPYTDSKDMIRDVSANQHLWYFPTDSGFGEDDKFHDHPLFGEVPGMPGTRYNDLFRAVHDYYAHAQHGHQFGPQGELRAWVEHARMFSPLARKALTTETHGQNSWVNFGPHEPWKLPQTERPFADQKANILPTDVYPKVKLARRDLGDQGAFHRALDADPNDDTARLVYADWLDENGQPEAAHRLRWFTNAKAHTPTTPGDTTSSVYGVAPQWADHLTAVHNAHRALDATAAAHDPKRLAQMRRALSITERHILGLASDKERKASEAVSRRLAYSPEIRHDAASQNARSAAIAVYAAVKGDAANANAYTYDATDRTRTPRTDPLVQAVLQYHKKNEQPTKLARGGSDERAFQEQMEANPNDHFLKSVYADWLEDHGDEASVESARKLRTWAKLHAFLDERRAAGGRDRVTEEEGRFQPWVRQLLAVHRARIGIRENTYHSSSFHRVLEPALHAVERHALGVGDPAELEQHRRAVRQQRDSYHFDDDGVSAGEAMTHAVHNLMLSTQYPGDQRAQHSYITNAHHWMDDAPAPSYNRAAKDHMYHGEQPTKLGRYTVRPAEGPPLFGGDAIHEIHDEGGNRIGHVWVTPPDENGRLFINHIGAAGHKANETGLANVRDVVRQLKGFYPAMKSLGGKRESGRRLGQTVDAPVRLARTPALDAHERAVAKNPKEWTGWLSLADHHEEAGNPEIAAHIRTYVDQAQNHPFIASPERDAMMARAYQDRRFGPTADLATHRVIEAGLAPWTSPTHVGAPPMMGGGVGGTMRPPRYQRSFFPDVLHVRYLHGSGTAMPIVPPAPEPPTKLARPETWVGQVRPAAEGNRYSVDHTAAKVFSDRLQETEDWRHHLFSHTVDGPTAYAHKGGPPVTVPHMRRDKSHSLVSFSRDGTALVTHAHPAPNGGLIRVFSMFHPEDYLGLLREARKSGVNFPAPPAEPPTKLARRNKAYTVRFNLKPGPDKGKWEVIHVPSGEVKYFDPAQVSLRMTGAALVNRKHLAGKINTGEIDKTRTAWVAADNVDTEPVRPEPPRPEALLLYNPHVLPHWHDTGKNNLDNTEYRSLVTHGTKVAREEPERLARPDRQPGTGAAVRAQQTDTHATRLQVAKQVLAEAGVRGLVRSVQAHTDKRGVRPGFSVTIGEPVPHALARYLGAYLGLLSGERRMTVFHPGDGEDVLHVIDTPHDQAHVGEYLKRSGVPTFSLERKGTGTRAYVVNPMDLVDIDATVKGLSASAHNKVVGSAVRLGDPASDKDARSAFRQVIQDAES